MVHLPRLATLAKNLQSVELTANNYDVTLFYSYNTLIAFEHLRILYWNTDRHTTTTDRHLSIVRNLFAVNMQTAVHPLEFSDAINTALSNEVKRCG